MAPCINLYNNQVNDNTNWENWDENAGGRILLPDYEKYAQLCIVLGDIVSTLSNSNDLYMCDTHAEIGECVRAWVPTGSTFNICNVDHHHDWGYGDYDQGWERLTEGCGCGNWAAYLKRIYGDKFLSYVWVHNSNSDVGIFDYVQEQLPVYRHFTTDISEINNLQFDKVFICCSSPWIPTDCKYLFIGMTDLLDKIIKK